ncbi:MAG TPA: hypothetical protein VLG47_00695 [Candidatus Saccharimonadales bacterium]|nr:hypothetical protein [Candidatus Saccharimonadales bacterium]
MPTFNTTGEARREARRVSRLSPAELGLLFDESTAQFALGQPLRSEIAKAHARRQKPQLFGRAAILVSQSLEEMFGGRTYNGVPGLLRFGSDGKPKEASSSDRRTLNGLQSCWADTLFFNMIKILEPARQAHEPWYIALEALTTIRMRAGGSDRKFSTMIQTDALNAATQALRIGIGMGKYQRSVTKTKFGNPGNVEVIASSPQPLLSVASLSAEQMVAYAEEYLGRRNDGHRATYGIHPKLIAGDTYETSAAGLITLESNIDGFPIGEDTYIANIISDVLGLRIGCPLIFWPDLADVFWRGTTNSAGEANLL